ncbi:MAG TPA: signal peptidase I [bacterium]|nr:signal peptidase I [bacterium]HPR89555.1 signal peptidase I [bacterium]
MSGKGRQIFKEYFEALTVALVAALILRMLVIQAFRIPTGSMKDTLLVGDFLLVNKFVYGANTPDRIPLTDIKLPSLHMPAIHQPKRGDIIVFKYPLDEKLDYIKRCIGVPGDTLELRKGLVYINHRPEGEIRFLERRFDDSEGRWINYYRVHTPEGRDYTIRRYEGFAYDFGPVVVPPRHLFMMGDNRDNSQDSRYWGFMPMQNIRGQAMVIYFSYDHSESLLHRIRWSRIFGIIR